MRQQATNTTVLTPVTGTAGRVRHIADVTDTPKTRTRLRHVVHVSLGTDVGGMEKLLVDFAKHIDRSRFQLTFISLQERGRLAAALEKEHWPVYALDKRPGVRPLLIWKLARQFRKLHADVVHTHNTAAFTYGVPAARLAGVPRIIHTRHGQRYAASARETRLFRWLARLTDHLVAVSDDARQLSIAEGIAPERVSLIRNGVDLQSYAYAGPREGGPVTLVARLSPEKDVATLIHAVPHVLRLLGPRDSAFGLTIVGDGSTRAQLERLSHALGLANVVRFSAPEAMCPDYLARPRCSSCLR